MYINFINKNWIIKTQILNGGTIYNDPVIINYINELTDILIRFAYQHEDIQVDINGNIIYNI
jgi:hypothetical protein